MTSLRNVKLRDILDPSPATASPDESASSAWERMRSLKVNHLVVLKDRLIVGVLSRRDLSGPAGGTHRRMGRRVGELMRGPVITASPTTALRSAVLTIRRKQIDCLPVVRRGKMVGIVTVSQLLGLLERELAK
jgi:CBS domain-containing protein